MDLSEIRKRRTVPHIGMWKGASTSLQENLFSKHPEIHLLGKPYPSEDAVLFADRLERSDSVSYDGDWIVEEFRSLVADARPEPGDLVVWSDERFSRPRADRARIPERLQGLIGDSQVLFVTRQQRDVLKSGYAQWLKSVPSQYSYKSFEDWLSYEWVKYRQWRPGVLRDLHYDETLGEFARVFGSDSIQVLPFEALVEDAAAFEEELCERLDIPQDERSFLESRPPKNTRMEGNMRALKAWQGKLPENVVDLVPRSLLNVVREHLPPQDGQGVDLPDEWEERLDTLYSDTNATVSDEYSVDLDKYGYQM